MDLKKLKEPFPEQDVEWRIAQSGIKDGKPWAKVLAYITGRALQERLDDVCGAENWKNEFKEWHTIVGKDSVIHSQLCGISIRINDEWITKWNGAECTDTEPIKGGLSSAEKRTGTEWGIASYLYGVKDQWAMFYDDNEKLLHKNNGMYSCQITDKETQQKKWYYWNPPKLSPEFLPHPVGKGLKEGQAVCIPNAKDKEIEKQIQDTFHAESVPEEPDWLKQTEPQPPEHPFPQTFPQKEWEKDPVSAPQSKKIFASLVADYNVSSKRVTNVVSAIVGREVKFNWTTHVYELSKKEGKQILDTLKDKTETFKHIKPEDLQQEEQKPSREMLKERKSVLDSALNDDGIQF